MGNTRKLPSIQMSKGVIDAINEELVYQSTLQGSGRADAWTKNAGDEAALSALRKVAAIAVRALEQYGCPTRGK